MHLHILVMIRPKLDYELQSLEWPVPEPGLGERVDERSIEEEARPSMIGRQGLKCEGLASDPSSCIARGGANVSSS